MRFESSDPDSFDDIISDILNEIYKPIADQFAAIYDEGFEAGMNEIISQLKDIDFASANTYKDIDDQLMY